MNWLEYNEQYNSLLDAVQFPATLDQLFTKKKFKRDEPLFRDLYARTISTDELRSMYGADLLLGDHRYSRFINGDGIKFGWIILEWQDTQTEATYNRLVPIGWNGEHVPSGMVSYPTYQSHKRRYDQGELSAMSLLSILVFSDEFPKELLYTPDSSNARMLNSSTPILVREELFQHLTILQRTFNHHILYVIPSYGNIVNLERVLRTWVDYVLSESRYISHLYLYAQGYSLEDQERIYGIIPSALINFITVKFVAAYPQPISQTLIRNTAYTAACLEAIYSHTAYVLGDDDFEFKSGSGAAYDTAIDYLLNNPAIGLIQCSGYLGGYYKRSGLLTRWNGHFWMDRGIIGRPLMYAGEYQPLFLMSDIGKLGGLFETYLFIYYAEQGYGVATMKNTPTLHRSYRHNSKSRGQWFNSLKPADLEVHMHNQRFIDAAITYFNSVLGAGTYSVVEYAPHLQLKYKGPSLQFFLTHYDRALANFGYCAYTQENGNLSRGLPKGWRDALEHRILT